MHPTLKSQLDVTFRDITSLGSFSFFILLIVLAFLSGETSLSYRLLFGFIVTLVVVILIRSVYYKDRPHKEKHHNYVERIIASSFPSLHAARLTFLALIFSLFFNNTYLTILFTVVALLVIYSRYYIHKHDWIDLSGGIVLGAITWWITTLI